MVQMNKPGELDLRTALPQPDPRRCNVSDSEAYEVRFEVLSRRGAEGRTTQMHVLRSTDGGKNWKAIRLRRNWRRHWWAIFWKGLGGSSWPPAGEDVNNAYVKDGRFTIAYWNLYEFGPRGQAYAWEMQYDPSIDRWNLALLEEIWPDQEEHPTRLSR